MTMAGLIDRLKERLRLFPWIRQRDSMQCGVTALAIVMRHYGGRLPLFTLEEKVGAGKTGVSMLALSEAAREIGFETMSVRTSVERLREAPLPAILHWNQNHYTVLYRISRGGTRFHISDPAKGRVTLTEEEFRKGWCSTTVEGTPKGVALLLQPGEEFDALARPEGQPEGGSLRRDFRLITSYLHAYRGYFLQIGFGLILGCLLQLCMPFLTQGIVDVGIRQARMSVIWLIVIGEIVIITGRTASDFIRRWLVLHISMRINISLVSDFIIRLLSLPMVFFDGRLMGDLQRRIADHSRIQSFLTGQTLNITFAAMTLVVFTFVLAWYDATILLVFLAFAVAYTAWIMAFLSRRRVLDYDVFAAQGAESSNTYQLLSAMQEIKLQDAERRHRWKWEDTQADLFETSLKAQKLQQTQEAGAIFINEMKNVVITVIAASAVIKGTMTLGQMMAMQFIVGQLNGPVEQLMAFVMSFQDLRLSLERINEIHDARPEEDASRGPLPCRGAGSIRVRDLTFRYVKHSPHPVLDGIDAVFPAGKTTAVVGSSGSGKTTLLKLLLGYYEPERGAVEVDGVPLDGISLREWRRACGTVMQDGYIFSESIADNIAADDAPNDMERIREAARVACILDHVERLPLGFDTVIGREGNGLSQGQKQRILIARAVYRNPRFFFLDEATNSLDATTERCIVENLREFLRDRTSVIIAHRLSTARDADNIIVMDGGRIVEQGTHEQLTALRGHYYRLVRNQLELGS